MGDKTINLATAIDDSYTLPLLVMLRSACRNLSAGWNLCVFILGYQITANSRAELESGLDGLPVRVHWKTLDLEPVRPYWPAVGAGGGITIYYRLFLGDVLPGSAERVIFVDADVLVEGDLAELWDSPFDGHIVQAVPDAYSDLNVARLARVDFSNDDRFAAGTPYFNAGVMLVDLSGCAFINGARRTGGRSRGDRGLRAWPRRCGTTTSTRYAPFNGPAAVAGSGIRQFAIGRRRQARL